MKIQFKYWENTFSIKGFDSKIHDFLLKKKILTSVSNQQTSPEYFKKKKLIV